MEKKRLTEQEAKAKIESILAELPSESDMAKALRSIVNGVELEDDLRQVRIPEETLREWEAKK